MTGKHSTSELSSSPLSSGKQIFKNIYKYEELCFHTMIPTPSRQKLPVT
jgi:hypothetical protein